MTLDRCPVGVVRINDGRDIKLFILVGLGRFLLFFFVYCLAPRGSTVGFLLLQCSSGVVREPKGSPGVARKTLFLSSPVKPV